MVQELAQLKFRIAPGLKAKIDKAAAANRRTVQGEIIARLEASFADNERSKAAASNLLRIGMSGDPLEAQVATLKAQVAALEARVGALENK